MIQPHRHSFLGRRHDHNARRTWLVIGLTTIMMVAEIGAGTWFGSMALLADGWHMATHAGALLIAAAAYTYARRHEDDPRFSFGTGKVGDLAAFASAIVLALVALLIAWESIVRLFEPTGIDFAEAILVAVVGLAVNAVSAVMLHEGSHDHEHGTATPVHHSHHHSNHGGHHHGHARDANLRAAYLHVLADALTSVLAIIALLAGRYLGWVWLDPVVGFAGACVILVWSRSLLSTAAMTLLDMVPNQKLLDQARQRLETSGAHVIDLHMWRLGPGHTGITAALSAANPQPVAHYRHILESLPSVAHVTVEVHQVSD